MRIHVFQHVQYEDIGSIAEWIQKNDHKVNYSKFYENFKFPNIDDFDLLIVMGGPMSTSDDIKFPWLKEEKKFIKEAIEQGKYILGICLGAQLIAECLGSNVHHNKQKEIGWYSIRKSENSINNGLLPEILKTFHWHGDTFDLPKDAILLASSEATENQAFLYKYKIAGLQFHMEVTEESLQSMVSHGKEELVPDKYVQSEDELLEKANLIKLNNSFMEVFLNNFITQI